MLDYKKKYEKLDDEFRGFKNAQEHEKRDLRRQIDEQRRECLEKSTKAECAGNKIDLLEDKVEREQRYSG